MDQLVLAAAMVGLYVKLDRFGNDIAGWLNVGTTDEHRILVSASTSAEIVTKLQHRLALWLEDTKPTGYQRALNLPQLRQTHPHNTCQSPGTKD